MRGINIKIIVAQQARVHLYNNIKIKLLNTNTAILFTKKRQRNI